MNRLMIILGLAATAAISAPASAQTNCRWWDVNCRTTSTRTGRVGTRVDGSWHVAGRDANRNINRGRNRSEVRYGANGAICKYKENDRGYKEDCRYPKPAKKLRKYKVARNDRVEDRRVNRDGVWYDVGNGRGKGKYKNH
jgi:hypothetical protein